MRKKSSISLCLMLCCVLSGYSQKEESCKPHYDILHQRMVYYLVDEAPSYPAGEMSILNTLMRHLKWPSAHYCISGKVVVSMIVEMDGSISDKKILGGLGSCAYSLEEEVLTALSYLKDWQAGSCCGKVVPVRVLLPIRICLE